MTATPGAAVADVRSADVRSLVDDRPEAGLFRVHRSAMTSEALFALEQERIFAHAWLYVAHASEFDAVSVLVRCVGNRTVQLVRADGVLQAFLHSCPACGAALDPVADPAGGGWCAADDRFWGRADLEPIPQVDDYRGFVFACLDAHAGPLSAYLGGVTEYIDLVVDQSEVGMRVLPGSQEFGFRANWKLYVENVLDTYHVLPVHQTYFQYLAGRGGGVKYHGRRDGTARALGSGHAVAELEASYARPVARWDPTFGEESRPEIEAIRARLVALHGEGRAYRMADTIRLTLTFPNFILADIAALTIRSVTPIAPDRTVVQSWALAPVEESDRLLKRRLESYLAFIGPGGFATPDDVEAVESCQAGFAASAVEWSDLSRGVHRSPNPNHDEVQLQTFWRHWRDQLSGESL